MINSVILVGRLTKDPELKYTSNNNSMCSFTLAVDKRVNGEKQANFINCKVFNKQAENLCQYQSKGSLIGVVGVIDTGSYQNKQGQTVYTTDILVNQITFLQSKGTSKNDNIMDYLTNNTSNNFQDNGIFGNIKNPFLDD